MPRPNDRAILEALERQRRELLAELRGGRESDARLARARRERRERDARREKTEAQRRARLGRELELKAQDGPSAGLSKARLQRGYADGPDPKDLYRQRRNK